MQGERDLRAVAVDLMRGCRADSGIKREVAGVAVRGFGFDIAAALALGASLAAAAGAAAREAVEWRVKPAGFKLLADLDLVATIPPAAVLGSARDNLAGGVNRLVGLWFLSLAL